MQGSVIIARSAGRGWIELSRIWKKARKFVFHRVLHADDTPHRIALGVAIATLIAFTPLLGFHTVIALAIAAAWRANKAVCIPLVWITNPLTAGPIYWFCWRLGSALLPTNGGAEFHTAVRRFGSAWSVERWSRLLEWDFWRQLVALLADLGVELWLGCIIVGVVSGSVMYGLSIWGVTVYRRRRHQRKVLRDARRTERLFRQTHASRDIRAPEPALPPAGAARGSPVPSHHLR
jgi:uncharacterized protein (DUF2062 family)